MKLNEFLYSLESYNIKVCNSTNRIYPKELGDSNIVPMLTVLPKTKIILSYIKIYLL